MNNPTSRKHRTARRIQAAAVRLAAQLGMAGLTAEAIAREAGISTRTFFNYYPFKEAALIGPPPDYPPDAAETFVEGRGRLIDDLHKLLEKHLSRYVDEREQAAIVWQLSRTDLRLRTAYQDAQIQRRTEMAALLRRRVPNADQILIEILAAAITTATSRAHLDWLEGRVDDLAKTALIYVERIGPAVGLLNRKPD